MCPPEILETLQMHEVRYMGFDGRLHVGQIVVSKDVAEEVMEFFEAALELKFPIAKVEPAVVYGWDDNQLMARNISSGYN